MTRANKRSWGQRAHRRGAENLWMVALIPVLLAGAALPATGQTVSTIESQCMQDRYGSKLNCTANDVRIAKADILASTGCDYVGDLVDFTAQFTVLTTATERYDVGLYFAVDGDPNKDGAYSGTCSISILPTGGEGGFINIDQYDRYGNDTGDRCGDIGTKYTNPLLPVITVTNVKCVDSDNDGFLDFPNCTSWRQSGDSLCDDPTDAFPGTTSKCKCDIGFDVPITVPPGELKVTKTAVDKSLPEPGGQFKFDFTVENFGADPNNYVVITKLVDKVGTVETSLLDTTKVLCTGPNLENAPVPYGYQLPNGQTLSCSFFKNITGNAGYTETDTVIAVGHDKNFPTEDLSGQASATISITNVMPKIGITKSADPTQVNEGPASPVTFTVVISNQSTASTDDLTITSLVDDIYGSLVGKATCGGSLLSLPHTLAYGGTLTCSFTGNVPPSGWGQAGDSYTDVVKVIAHDNDPSDAYPNGNEVWDSDTATVTVKDAGAATIEVVKTAVPQSVPETGGLVSYGVSIKNLSAVDTVYIDTLTDTVFGNIADPNNTQLTAVGGVRTTCNILTLTLAPGQLKTCYFYASLSGEPTGSHVNVLTASGWDDDKAPVSDSDDETVTFTDVQPNASVDKTVTSMRVTYSVVVTNLADEPMTVLSLLDDQFGELTDNGNSKLVSTTCAAGAMLAKKDDPEASYACSFVADVTKSPHTNTVTATVDDNDAASPASKPTSSAVVTFGKP